ncbi:MAG: enoyl-CoA hydratase [Chloroflexi bacterium]|nr:enoyl-CoA hydratase [Chloroflexota bacterium]MBI3931536.1 enoyl-CoA hydratase [Chloroflexota bacterium]
MNYEGLLLEKKDGIATITLNVPEKLNALTEKIRMNLPLVIGEIAKDDDVRVVIVTGAGRGFCSGADVTAMTDRERPGEPAEVSRYARVQGAGWPVEKPGFPDLNKPVIAAINGPCVGGGLSLAMSCDIRIASETARFSVAQVTRGLVPDWSMSYFLPTIIGISRALEMMFTAELISAAEAERLGIVSRVVPPDNLMKAAQELAVKIAQQPPLSVQLTKKIVLRRIFDELTRQLDLEAWGNSICLSTEDHREAVRAFLEKRPPQFKGR